MASGPALPRPASSAPWLEELDLLVRARYPLLYLVTWEEHRVDTFLAELARAHGKHLLTWSVTRGLKQVGTGRMPPLPEDTRHPLAALAAIEKLTEPSLVVLKDFPPHLEDRVVVRALRELAHSLKSTFTTVILLSPTLHLPPELEKEVSVLDVPLPGFQELLNLLKEIVAVVRRGNKATVELSREEAEQLIKAAQGLTLSLSGKIPGPKMELAEIDMRFRYEEVAGPESVKLGIWAYTGGIVRRVGQSVKRFQIAAAA